MNHATRPFWIILAAFLGAAACARFVSWTDDGYHEELGTEGATQVAVMFSHNVNGETQPCGCRQFPLGGLEQAAGRFAEQRAKSPVIYVDTGDLFFPNTNIPGHLRDSHLYTAEFLVDAMEKLGLKFFVPGDQDFALGRKWLEGISQKARFTFLMANLRGDHGFKAKPWAEVFVGKKRLVFIGVVDPDLLTPEDATYFTSTEVALAAALKSASPKEGDQVFLLSHSGMEKDRRLAKLNPRLNWIIGAHSQSYTTRSFDEGNTQLVQVLSRNHYIGNIGIGIGATDNKTTFALVETREESKKLVDPNPMEPLMSRWRMDVARIQAQEQKSMAGQVAVDPLPTFNSCVDCHKPQTAFWQGSSHAIAWQTLTAKGSDNDPSCVGCHSLGWQHPQGFSRTPDRVLFEGKPNETKLAQYTADLSKAVGEVKTPRTLSAAQRKIHAQAWMKNVETHQVSHDFGNVQCVNCHDKNRDHPFDGTTTKTGKSEDMANKCLNCHTADQSPAWYNGTSPNMSVVNQHIKQVACPAK